MVGRLAPPSPGICVKCQHFGYPPPPISDDIINVQPLTTLRKLREGLKKHTDYLVTLIKRVGVYCVYFAEITTS